MSSGQNCFIKILTVMVVVAAPHNRPWAEFMSPPPGSLFLSKLIFSKRWTLEGYEQSWRIAGERSFNFRFFFSKPLACYSSIFDFQEQFNLDYNESNPVTIFPDLPLKGMIWDGLGQT